jgi:hypothetical protein
VIVEKSDIMIANDIKHNSSKIDKANKNIDDLKNNHVKLLNDHNKNLLELPKKIDE